MKNLILTFPFSIIFTVCLHAQTESTISVSDKIIKERDNELNSYKNILKENDIEIKRLQDKFSESQNTQVKITTLDGLQQKLDERLKALETASKRKANYNSQ